VRSSLTAASRFQETLRSLLLQNFKNLEGRGWRNFKKITGKQEKGQTAALKAFVSAIQGGRSYPILLGELLEVSRWSCPGCKTGPVRLNIQSEQT
jgi:hypothetical protein